MEAEGTNTVDAEDLLRGDDYYDKLYEGDVDSRGKL